MFAAKRLSAAAFRGTCSFGPGAGVQMISDPYSSDVRAFVLLLDIEEEKRREACEKKRAMTDELTGLLSRTSFIERFEDLCRSDHENARHAV